MLNNTDFLNPNNIKSAKIWIHYLNILAIFFGKYDINRQDSIIYFKTLIIPAILNSRLEYEIPFVLVYNVLDLNNQKILWLPSIYQFERTGTNLNHPKLWGTNVTQLHAA